MAKVFVATAAPATSDSLPLSLGRWCQGAKPGVWKERRADGSPVVEYTDAGPSGTPGSTTVRLQLQNDCGDWEVFLTSLSAIVLKNGAYVGEYVGHWEIGGRPEPPPKAKRASIAEGPGGKSQPEAAKKTRPQKAKNCDRSADKVEKLFNAAKSGEYAPTKLWLDFPVDPDCQASEGLTPLIIAAQLGHVAVVEVLIAAGADVNIGVDGMTPMIAAFQKGHKQVLRVLFAASFQTLEHAVGPGGAAVAKDSFFAAGDDEEVSAMALADLRGVTEKLASLSRPEEKAAPGTSEPHEPYDSGRMREEMMRETMRHLVGASGPRDRTEEGSSFMSSQL